MLTSLSQSDCSVKRNVQIENVIIQKPISDVSRGGSNGFRSLAFTQQIGLRFGKEQCLGKLL